MTKSWEEHKETIITQYKENNKPLHEVQRFMEDRHGFKASFVPPFPLSHSHRTSHSVCRGSLCVICVELNGRNTSPTPAEVDQPILCPSPVSDIRPLCAQNPSLPVTLRQVGSPQVLVPETKGVRWRARVRRQRPPVGHALPGPRETGQQPLRLRRGGRLLVAVIHLPLLVPRPPLLRDRHGRGDAAVGSWEVSSPAPP